MTKRAVRSPSAGKEDDDIIIIGWSIRIELDPDGPKAKGDVVILLDEFYQDVMRKQLASCPREVTGVLAKFEKIDKHDRLTLIRDCGPDEGGRQDTLFHIVYCLSIAPGRHGRERPPPRRHEGCLSQRRLFEMTANASWRMIQPIPLRLLLPFCYGF